MIKQFLALMLFYFLTSTAYAEANKSYCSNQLLAKPISHGFTWTLTSRLAQALREAEKRYGERDHHWTILGVEFTANGQPQVWYPFSNDDEKFIIVQLTQKASCDDKEALFQLSHEVIHLLSPTGGDQQASVFEEGLAAYFSIQFLNQQNFQASKDYIQTTGYKEAYEAVAMLYQQEEDVDKKIEILRLENNGLSNISKAQFMQAFPNIDEGLAEQLAGKFK